MRNQSMPALVRTVGVSGAYAVTFMGVGAVYAGGECLAEGIRGKHDFWNGVFGGFAAGTVLGVRIGRPGVSLGAGAALAAMSAVVDSSGRSLRGSAGDDLPQRTYFPYATEK